MFQLPQFVWALRSSVWGVFINFLLIDPTDKSKISIDQKRFFIALSLYPLSFFANTPFKWTFILGVKCSCALLQNREITIEILKQKNMNLPLIFAQKNVKKLRRLSR